MFYTLRFIENLKKKRKHGLRLKRFYITLFYECDSFFIDKTVKKLRTRLTRANWK